jgi:hypothetical protein
LLKFRQFEKYLFQDSLSPVIFPYIIGWSVQSCSLGKKNKLKKNDIGLLHGREKFYKIYPLGLVDQSGG